MSINRVHKKGNYSVIANNGAHDTALTWQARGILWYLLTKPDGWLVRTGDLVKQSPQGLKAVNSVLKELESSGYLIRWCDRGDRGKFEWRSEIFESKQEAQEWYLSHEDELNQALRFSTGTGEKLGYKDLTIPPLGIDGESIDGQGGYVVNTERTIPEKLKLINLDLKHKHKQVVGRSGDPTIALPDFLISNSENFPESDEEVKTQSSIPVKNSDTANPENEIKTPTPNPLPRAAKVRRIDRDVEMQIEVKVRKPPQATKIIFKENDFGWLQMPSTKVFKLARRVATRRLQNQMAPLFSNIKWSKNDRGELILVNAKDNSPIESESFSVSEWLDLASLRDQLLEKELLSQDDFNGLLEAIFIDSVKWCKKMGTIALKTIEPENAIANLFAQSDRNLLASIRGN